MSEPSRVERIQVAGTVRAGDDDWVVSVQSDSRDGALVLESASQERVLLFLAARVWFEGREGEEQSFYLVPLISIANGEQPLEEEIKAWLAARSGASSVVRGKVRLENKFLYQGRCGCRATGDDTQMRVEHSQDCVETQRRILKKERREDDG